MNIKKSTCAISAAFLLAACGSDDDSNQCDTNRPGVICTIAGSGENGYAGDDGPALRANLSLPQDTLTAANGDIYLLDWNNHRIRKVSVDGKIHHVAGRGELGGSLDSPANSDFNHPTAMIFDEGQQHIIIAAWHNSKIRTLDLATGGIEDTCGDGRRAYAGDDGPAKTASLDLPTSIALDSEGRLVIMDQANQVIRRVDTDGTIHRLSGQCIIDRPAPEGPGACAEGQTPTQCPATGPSADKFTCGEMSSCTQACNPAYGGDDGPALEMRIAQPFGQSADPGGRIAFDRDGNLYFADASNSLIRMIDRDGIVHRVAGLAPVEGVPQSGYSGDGGPATEAMLHNPVDLAFATDGTLYFSDVYNHCIRAIRPDGTIETVVGRCGVAGRSGDGGPAKEALLKRPYGIEWVNGVLHIADTGNSVIRSVRLP